MQARTTPRIANAVLGVGLVLFGGIFVVGSRLQYLTFTWQFTGALGAGALCQLYIGTGGGPVVEFFRFYVPAASGQITHDFKASNPDIGGFEITTGNTSLWVQSPATGFGAFTGTTWEV